MDNCEVLESFSGHEFSGAKGNTIELPHEIAIAYEHYGMVKIISEAKSPMAFETAKAAKEGIETPEVKKIEKKPVPKKIETKPTTLPKTVKKPIKKK